MVKAIVFDLGGTLMEYRGMPLNWSSYYITGFEKVNQALGLGLSHDELHKPAEILKSYNPRNNKRENEIAPEVIFNDAISGWKNKPALNKVIDIFFEGLNLEADIYSYSASLLKKCKNAGYKTACLTDLPNGMPDRLFQAGITVITRYLDLYVSSQTCGTRKPGKGGLCYIASAFNIKETEILFIGDEEKDFLTARNAKCNFIYIKDFLNKYYFNIQEVKMPDINFKSEWVEKCVRRALDKPEGAISAEEVSKIKYAKAGGDFSGSVVLELSINLPPEPFAAFDGGDEWAVCLHSDTTLGEKYNLNDYIEIDKDFYGFYIEHSGIKEWEYAYGGGEAENKWDTFEKSIVKNNIFDDYTDEEINQMKQPLIPPDDLKLLQGLVVLRLYEMEIENAEWFLSFKELKALELAETGIKEETGGVEAFSGLKQLTIWCD